MRQDSSGQGLLTPHTARRIKCSVIREGRGWSSAASRPSACVALPYPAYLQATPPLACRWLQFSCGGYGWSPSPCAQYRGVRRAPPVVHSSVGGGGGWAALDGGVQCLQSERRRVGPEAGWANFSVFWQLCSHPRRRHARASLHRVEPSLRPEPGLCQPDLRDLRVRELRGGAAGPLQPRRRRGRAGACMVAPPPPPLVTASRGGGTASS
jgi:hypothetical protein